MKTRFAFNDPIYKQRRKDLRKSSTKGEKILWRRLNNRQLNGIKFYRQYGIGPFIVDFYSFEIKLVIEVDGSSHDENKYEYDMWRQGYIESLGIKVIRFTEQEVQKNINGVITTIAEVTPPTSSLEEERIT